MKQAALLTYFMHPLPLPLQRSPIGNSFHILKNKFMSE